jgi:hypothetical protein
MRRNAREDTPKDVHSTGNLKADMTEKQLAAFGAAALAYNILEDQIDALLLVATGIREWLFAEVSSRINGLEGKIAIIQKAITCSLEPDDAKTLTGSVAIFGDLKKTRDAFIHARIINAPLGVGRGANRRGQSPFEVLLSADALDGFYDHVVALQRELSRGGNLFNSATALKQCAAGDPNKPRLEEEIRVHRAQFLQNHRHRLSLKPLPKFPSEEELREAASRLRETQILLRMGYPRSRAAMMSQIHDAWEPDPWHWTYQRNNALLNTYYPPGEPAKSDDNKDR